MLTTTLQWADRLCRLKMQDRKMRDLKRSKTSVSLDFVGLLDELCRNGWADRVKFWPGLEFYSVLGSPKITVLSHNLIPNCGLCSYFGFIITPQALSTNNVTVDWVEVADNTQRSSSLTPLDHRLWRMPLAWPFCQNLWRLGFALVS